MAEELYCFLQNKETGTYHLQIMMLGSHESICGENDLHQFDCQLSIKKHQDEKGRITYKPVKGGKNYYAKDELRILLALLQNDAADLANFFNENEIDHLINAALREQTHAVPEKICRQCVSKLYKED